MNRLVDRFGRTGFAALSSVIWAVPMAAWAGSFDLSPMDHTAYPWIAFAIGLVMLIVWLALLSRLSTVEVTPRPHRLDFARMSRSERRWNVALAAFALAALAWLNAAATVDWTPLVAGVEAGKPGAIAFAGTLAVFLAAMLGGAWLSWRRSAAAFAARASSSSSDVG